MNFHEINLSDVEATGMADATTDANPAVKATDGAAVPQIEQGNGPVTPTLKNPAAAGHPANAVGEPSSAASKTEPQSVLGATASVAIQKREIAASLVVLLLWIALLTCGITINTKPYMDAIAKATSLLTWEILGNLLVVLLCHTATNTALCCCLAAFLGVMGSRAVPTADPNNKPSMDRTSSYASAITRGFFVYLVLQSGAIVFSSDPFKTTTLEEYVRLVALSSLISFAVGFDPLLFQNMMTRVDTFAAGGGKKDGPVTPTGGPTKEK